MKSFRNTTIKNSSGIDSTHMHFSPNKRVATAWYEKEPRFDVLLPIFRNFIKFSFIERIQEHIKEIKTVIVQKKSAFILTRNTRKIEELEALLIQIESIKTHIVNTPPLFTLTETNHYLQHTLSPDCLNLLKQYHINLLENFEIIGTNAEALIQKLIEDSRPELLKQFLEDRMTRSDKLKQFITDVLSDKDGLALHKLSNYALLTTSKQKTV